jgi:phosphoserine phosphatase RsbU/P
MWFRRRGSRDLPSPEEPRFRLPASHPAADSEHRTVKDLLLRAWAGRLLLVSAAVRLVLFAFEHTAGPTRVTSVLASLAAVGLIVSLGYFAWRILVLAKRRLLWRLRRRLILSYVLIGVIPALLIVAFFLFATLLMFFHVSGYLFKRGIDDVVRDARMVAETTALEVERERGAETLPAVLDRRVADHQRRYEGLSVALVPVERAERGPRVPALAAGAWRHLDPPGRVPAWIGREGFEGLVALDERRKGVDAVLLVRAVVYPSVPSPGYAVVVDMPVDAGVAAEIREATGVELLGVDWRSPARDAERPTSPRRPVAPLAERRGAGGDRWARDWVIFLAVRDWSTGQQGTSSTSVRVSAREIYERMALAQSRIGSVNIGDLFMMVLVFIAVLFLLIEAVALIMGFALAKSITGSVHQLFEGTRRVSAGDFTHRIRIQTRDQLGDLAGSFNEMAASIESLLRETEEKKRLEEELRIAREIQMSLLPSGPLRMPGLALTALCVPAREVGGDYYDFFPLSETSVGLLIADVAGKGTSAALYMAELKGLMLSLSAIHRSPKQLLSEVNRILSAHLDSRSFITMTYAVVDLAARTFTYARAGHTPLIHLRGGDGRREARLLAPDGLVLGLRIDGIAEKFDALLKEVTIPLESGAVFVLYTDGITEAMDSRADLFGEERLQRIIEQHGHLPSDQLRERILREVEAFVGGADQHDDMTMILMKVEEPAPAVLAGSLAAARLAGAPARYR